MELSCEECGRPLVDRQKRFCSISCRNRPNGRKAGGRNNQGITKECEQCGKTFGIPPSRDRNYNVRACSRKCLAKLQSRERQGWMSGAANPSWKGGIQTYRQHRKDACERCGSTRNLLVHHRNTNRYDNRLENLETLCKRCHQIHHGCQKNLPTYRAQRELRERL